MYTIKVYEKTSLGSRALAVLSVEPDGRNMESVLRGFAGAFDLGGLSNYALTQRVFSISVNGVTIVPLCGLRQIVPDNAMEIQVELLPADTRTIKWYKSDEWLMSHLEDLDSWLRVGKVPQHTCIVCGKTFTREEWGDGFALDSGCGRQHDCLVRRFYGPHNVWVERRTYHITSGEDAGSDGVEWVAVVKIKNKLYDMRHSYLSGSFISSHRLEETERFERGCLGGLTESMMRRIYHEARGEWDEAFALRKRWE